MNHLFKLDSKFCIVTDGNGRVGKAIAIALALYGASINLAARNKIKTAEVTK